MKVTLFGGPLAGQHWDVPDDSRELIVQVGPSSLELRFGPAVIPSAPVEVRTTRYLPFSKLAWTWEGYIRG